jgi:hypothetical protein
MPFNGLAHLAERLSLDALLTLKAGASLVCLVDTRILTVSMA